MIAHWLQAGLNFLSPLSCLGCAVEIDRLTSKGGRFCAACWTDLKPLFGNTCLRCSAPVGPYVKTEQGCMRCAKERFAFDAAIAHSVYEGRMREIMLRSKKALESSAIPVLWENLYQQHQSRLEHWKIDAVISVPSHFWEKMQMQNSAPEELARAAGQSLRVPVLRNILQKHRRTVRQASLSAAERRKNLRGAFRVWRKPRLKGTTFLLVDDIMTTGATAHEVAKTLINAGAKKVYVAVLARGIGSH